MKVEQGSPVHLELSEREDGLMAWEALTKSSDNKITSYRMIKKSLTLCRCASTLHWMLYTSFLIPFPVIVPTALFTLFSPHSCFRFFFFCFQSPFVSYVSDRHHLRAKKGSMVLMTSSIIIVCWKKEAKRMNQSPIANSAELAKYAFGLLFDNVSRSIKYYQSH